MGFCVRAEPLGCGNSSEAPLRLSWALSVLWLCVSFRAWRQRPPASPASPASCRFPQPHWADTQRAASGGEWLGHWIQAAGGGASGLGSLESAWRHPGSPLGPKWKWPAGSAFLYLPSAPGAPSVCQRLFRGLEKEELPAPVLVETDRE